MKTGVKAESLIHQLDLPSKIKNILQDLVCPDDHSPLMVETDGLDCLSCSKKYPFRDGKIFFVENHLGVDDQSPKEALYLLKNFVKKKRWIFKMVYFLQPVQAIGPGQNLLAEGKTAIAKILNLGCGVPLYLKAGSIEMIQVDLFPYPGVDLVCSAGKLPFKDDAIDGIYNESLVEHLANPEFVVDEIERVLKPKGKAYLVIPQIAPYHASPDDFQRWTPAGGKNLLRKFKPLDVGVRHGPVSGLLWLLQDFLASLFSLGSQKMYSFLFPFFMVISFPLKFFDLILARLPGMEKVSCTIYYLVEKKAGPMEENNVRSGS